MHSHPLLQSASIVLCSTTPRLCLLNVDRHEAHKEYTMNNNSSDFAKNSEATSSVETGSEIPTKDVGQLHIPENQVAGHRAEGEKPGPLTDKAGRFYKPLQDNKRGKLEVEFYEKFWSKTQISPQAQSFFPRFYGSRFLESPGGCTKHEYAIVEDVTYKFKHPSVIDIKMGSRTWYPEADDDYIKKCLLKDRETTSVLLGFRISGMQVYDDFKKASWKADRNWCKALTVEGTRMALKQFFSPDPYSEVHMKSNSTASLYDGARCILSKLKELKAWFEEQTFFHFSSASVLLIYEGDTSEPDETNQAEDYANQISVKLIDFAHVVDGDGIIDHNFLGGLCSLIHVLTQILDNEKSNI